MKPVLEEKAEILYNRRVAPGYWRMGIKSARIARGARPGQFLEAKINPDYDPLLRRPLSINRTVPDKGIIELLYCLAGKGTRILSQKQTGQELDLIGPLGNSFTISAQTENAVLVGGGMGVAPLLFWAWKLNRIFARSSKNRKKNLYVIIGAKTKKNVLCERDFKNMAVEVRITTDDGSYGFKGLATKMLDTLLDELPGSQTAIYTCGPRLMLKNVAQLALKYGLLRCQVSLEEYMACGLGVCRGCAVKVKGQSGQNIEIESETKSCLGACAQGKNSLTERFSYKMVCSDGPVFEAGDIIW